MICEPSTCVTLIFVDFILIKKLIACKLGADRLQKKPWGTIGSRYCFMKVFDLLQLDLVGLYVLSEIEMQIYGFVVFSWQLAEDAGFPPGVVNTIPCSRDKVNQVADAILGNELVSKLSFTGSTATGKVKANLVSERLGCMFPTVAHGT